MQRPHRVWTEATEQVNAINHCSVTSEPTVKAAVTLPGTASQLLRASLKHMTAGTNLLHTDGVSLVNKGLTSGPGHKRCIYGPNANVKGIVVLIYTGPVASL